MILPTTAVRTIKLPSGDVVPALGQGTWHMAEHPQRRQQEIRALRSGLDLGMTLIDTAEMYADGRAEELVGEAIAGRRHEVFLVSKVLPANATRRGTIAACVRSLRRLRTNWLDLYLLHWRGQVPLEETIAAFEDLVDTGNIRRWGLSNFDISDMQELVEISGGEGVTTDQVLYNLTRRGIEYDLLPWCREQRIPIMAYSPIEQGRMLGHPQLIKIAALHGATPIGCRRRRRGLGNVMNQKDSAPVTPMTSLAQGQDHSLNVVIETPKGSRNKFKFDQTTGMFKLSKVLPEGMMFPYDFGFIPSTQAEDGDPFDVLVLMDEPAFPGCLVECRLVGVIEALQEEKGEEHRNDRLIAVASQSIRYSDVHDLRDLNNTMLEQVEEFFTNYQRVRGIKFKILAREGRRKAARVLEEHVTAKKWRVRRAGSA